MMLESSKYLQMLRENKGYSYRKMQELTHINRITYKKYEDNPLNADTIILLDIASKLNANLDVLFCTLKQDYLSQNEIARRVKT